MQIEDVVRFTLGKPGQGVQYRDRGAVAAAARAFHLTAAEVSRLGRGAITIVCRPSQFARFLIWRDEAGAPNDFKGLNARLEPLPCADPIINVAQR